MVTDNKIIQIIKARSSDASTVYYREPLAETAWAVLQDGHVWDFVNIEYKIVSRREYVIYVDRAGKPRIDSTTSNAMSNSDYGRLSDGAEYMLMREVYVKEMYQ